MARVIYQAVLNDRLSQTRVAAWLTSLDFPLENSTDFLQFSNARSCLLEVYLQLDKEKALRRAKRSYSVVFVLNIKNDKCIF